MIHILKKGNPIYKCICRYCGCEFTYAREDLRTWTGEKTVACPCCFHVAPHILNHCLTLEALSKLKYVKEEKLSKEVNKE